MTPCSLVDNNQYEDGDGDRRIGSPIPAGARNLLLSSVQIRSGAHSDFYSMRTAVTGRGGAEVAVT
jgi:hypothetical protein